MPMKPEQDVHDAGPFILSPRKVDGCRRPTVRLLRETGPRDQGTGIARLIDKFICTHEAVLLESDDSACDSRPGCRRWNRVTLFAQSLLPRAYLKAYSYQRR